MEDQHAPYAPPASGTVDVAVPLLIAQNLAARINAARNVGDAKLRRITWFNLVGIVLAAMFVTLAIAGSSLPDALIEE